METIYNATRYYETPNIANYQAQRARTLQSGVPSNIIRVFFRIWADDLVKWRESQIAGVDSSIATLYQHFPMFKTLDAKQAVVRAYDELLNDVDEAIVQIGSGDIHSFDLPQAVKLTKQGLPANIQTEFDRILRGHEVTQFWKTMGLTLAQVAAVFIPVVGPAIAVGIGLVATGIEIESLLPI